MMIMFRVEIANGGVPGPLLGNGTNTTVTMLYPSNLTEDLDSMGARQSVINRSAAQGRASYTVAKFVVVGSGGNGDAAYILPRGGTATLSGRRVGPYEELPPIGFGDRNDMDLGDYDVDAVTGGDTIIVWAEVR